MKKIIYSIMFILGLLIAMNITSFAYENVDVYVNGKKLETDQSAIVYQDRTMVPLRAICEKLNCEVEWDGSTNTALIENEITMVAVQIDNYTLSKKDRRIEKETTKAVPIDVPPIIVNQRTLVPARAIAEAINAEVLWDGARNRVDIILEYDVIDDFCNGYAGVSKNGKFGYINENRDVVIPLIYDDDAWHDFDSNGQVVVRKNGDEGIVDSRHNVVVPIQYDWIEDYNEYVDLYKAVKKNGMQGCLDKDGEVVVPFKYDAVWTEDLEEDTLIRVAIKAPRMDAFTYGFVDKYGNEVVTPYKEFNDGTCQFGFQRADSFYEGRARVCYGYGIWGYIDESGDYVIEEQYQDAGNFSEGLAYAQYNGYYGYVDKYGNEEIGFEYEDADNFSEGLAAVEMDGKWGYINKRGKVVIPFEYDDACWFSQGMARVEKNGYYGFVNKDNELIIPCIYNDADLWFNSNGTVEVEKDGIDYELDMNGNVIKQW